MLERSYDLLKWLLPAIYIGRVLMDDCTLSYIAIVVDTSSVRDP